MIVTDDQRRWWFATHPEFSSRTSGRKSGTRSAKSSDPDKVSPEDVDRWADEALRYQNDQRVREIVKLAKFWFGTEFESKSPEEKRALLRDDEDEESGWNGDTKDDYDAELWFRMSPPPVGPAQTDEEKKREERRGPHFRKYSNEELRAMGIPTPEEEALISDPHTALDVFPYRRFITAPVSAVKDLFRSTARGTILNAVKKGKTEGPGKWVEVQRSRVGLEHQSKMSGQTIRESGGKYYIKEYDVNGVKFDDYRDGKLYDYKGPHGELINKEGEFGEWVTGAKNLRGYAERQVRAARGVPVIWKVGAGQVKAFRKAVGKIPGFSIEP